jgi:DNA end-binding protein Ku
MAARPTWKGVLQIALVHVPIKLYPATEASETISFHLLHADCQTRITQPRTCATCDRSVPSDEIVKAFEFEPGQYVQVLPEEFDAIAPPSSRVLTVTAFAPAEQLELRHINRTYLVEADGAEETFRTVQAALVGRVGLGVLTLYGRESLVALGLSRGVLLLYTLHCASELRPLTDVATSDRRYLPEVATMRKVLAAMTGPLDLTGPTQYQADLRALLAAKIAGQEIVQPTAIAAMPIVNLREALTKSLDLVSAAKKTPAKAAPAAAKRKRAS